ncbi:uncharacterized protein LOC132749698 isoform X4 [Ruditapes philippinarum]|uniref:uncharacterized protein LOC132749698 isoform X4 n=1 Tax=Ruditapes philippinarum TaxID=129788 RepID=UPI00295ACB0E|nr:uncharacterized protein LOC132749698 isoform X4 [Ruditapes philippinarum]
MSTNTGKVIKTNLTELIGRKKKQKAVKREPSDGQIVTSIAIPSVPNNNPDTNLSGLNIVSTGKGEKNKSDTDLHCIKTAPSKKSPRRFSEGREVDHQVLRSPSRLGYSEDIPIIREGQWENTSQDSNREDFQFLDLNDITGDQEQDPQVKETDIETKDSGQQTDFPVTPTTPVIPSSQRTEPRSSHFVSSHKYLLEKGSSPKHPYEKTVFFVQSSPNSELKKTATTRVKSAVGHSKTSADYNRSVNVTPSTRVDSGYSSRPETIRIQSSPGKSSVQLYSDRTSTAPTSRFTSPGRQITSSSNNKNVTYDSNRVNFDDKVEAKSPIMSFYSTDIISPMSSARKQEKEDLQMLNDRFSTYIQKVRLLSEQNNRIDASTFVKQTRILEEEVANLKTLYERELDAMRQELNAINREKSNYQLQCEKNKQAAIDFESRMAVETDKNRRLMDDMNQLQQKNNNLEAELMNMRQAGDGRSDFMHLQREMDKIIRENEDHKRRQEQESLLRTEAEDRCHTLTKKLEFNEQVHAQQLAELRERLEQNQALVISLESRLSQATKNDIAIPEVLKQVREQAEHELKKYQVESEENYTRNISALKCQMDNDAHRIELLSSEKSQLQGQIGELTAKIRNLEGQILTLEHQRSTVEDLIKQERDRFSSQLQEMNLKLRDMQELVFTKMREASNERDVHIPLKAEIEAMKILMEEEERRLQLPLTATHPHPSTYTTGVPLTLPAVSATVTQAQAQPEYVASPTQLSTATEQNAAFTTQGSAYTQQYGEQHTQFYDHQTSQGQGYGEQTSQGESLFTHIPLSCSTDPGATDYIGSTKYTYETTPSLNRLHIDSPPRNSPRAIGPITRAKSAPVRPGSSVQVVPTKLGQGKDYFDEMFKDLTRETLYTQTRPKSSPMERPPSAKQRERPSSRSEFLEMVTESQPIPEMTKQERPRSAASDHVDRVLEPRQADRPQSSVFHDYTTATSSAVGDIKILEVNQDGKFIRLFNDGKQEIEFGGYMIQQNVGGHPVAVFRFPPRTKFADESTITIWSGSQDPKEHQPPKDFVWKEQQKWGTGPECTTILCKPNGQAIAWMTAAHRFTKNLYEESLRSSTTEHTPIPDTGVPTTTGQDEVLTEMNVNLNEPKQEPVYLRREKQSPPSLNAQKHPHGTSPSKETHPHTGQPRPFTYGNDNSSVNRQSRVQSTRPDPIPGQPYAGGSATRIGSAPLRKYHGTANTGNIRGSGAIANRSARQNSFLSYLEPGMTSEPPNPFQTPHRRFEKGMEQLQSQHHVSFNPPMPRPPLFSTW